VVVLVLHKVNHVVRIVSRGGARDGKPVRRV